MGLGEGIVPPEGWTRPDPTRPGLRGGLGRGISVRSGAAVRAAGAAPRDGAAGRSRALGRGEPGGCGARPCCPARERGVLARIGAAAGPGQRRAGSVRLCGAAPSAPSLPERRLGRGVCGAAPLGSPHLRGVCAARAALCGQWPRGEGGRQLARRAHLCRGLDGIHPVPAARLGRWKVREGGGRGRRKRKGSAGREKSGIPLCQR